VIAFAANVLGVFDPDMFHHLALGRDIVRSGLRSEDPFLFPMRGQAVGPMPYWLGSVLLYGWHVLFGDGGLAFLPSLVAAITFIILFLDTSPRSGRHTPLTLAAAALPLALAIATFRYRATARTELFAVLFVALTLWGIRRLEDGRPRALLGFPLLALVWTNVHTSVVVGAGLVGIFAAVGLAAHGAGRALGRPIPGCPSRRQIATAAAVAAAGLALSLLNPSPMNPVLSALRFAGSAVGAAGVGPEASDGLGRAMAIVRRLVDEMRPPGAAFWLGPPGLLLGLTAVSFALRWRALRWREVVTFALFASLATLAQRFMVFFAIPCAPIAARNLGEALAAVPERLGRWRARLAAGGVLACAALAVPIAAHDPTIRPGTGFRLGAYPVRAVDYLQAIGFEGNLYNRFSYGGYLEWRGVGRVFQDGRGILPLGQEEVSMIGPSLHDRFAELDAQYRFDALVLGLPESPPGRPILPGSDWWADKATWSLVAFDDGGLLYLRRDGRYAERAARDEYLWARPSYSDYSWPTATVGGILEDYRRSVAEVPACVICRYFHAVAAFTAGLPEEALRTAAPALDGGDMERGNVVRIAAKAAEVLGRDAEAGALYTRLLATGLDDRSARRALARLALKADDLARAGKLLDENLSGGQPQREDVELAMFIAGRRGDATAMARWQADLERLNRQASGHDLLLRGVDAYNARNLVAAVTWMEASVQAFDANPAAHSNLAYAYLDLGRVEEAIRGQRRAIALDPKFSAAHYGLGMALERAGDRAGATAAFRRYLDLEPTGYFSVKAVERLTALERR
jgi:Tfp pilus assembly protein PilF